MADAAADPLRPVTRREARFAILLHSLDELFYPFDATPLPDRLLSSDVRAHLLDEWEWVRKDPPRTLVVWAPEAERADADESALRSAITTSLRAASRPLRIADPMPRSERIATRVGVVALLVCIAISTALDRASEDVLVEGISQGILVVGWVALWLPADRFVAGTVPHFFNRRRYAEFADIELDFRWY
jgi:hypothetical protein